MNKNKTEITILIICFVGIISMMTISINEETKKIENIVRKLQRKINKISCFS